MIKFFQTDLVDKEAFLLDEKSLIIDITKVRPDVEEIIIGYEDTKDLIIFTISDGEKKTVMIGTGK
jgi:hypothetical protein